MFVLPRQVVFFGRYVQAYRQPAIPGPHGLLAKWPIIEDMEV